MPLSVHSVGSRVRGPKGSGWERVRWPSAAMERAAEKATAERSAVHVADEVLEGEGPAHEGGPDQGRQLLDGDGDRAEV